MRLMLVYRSQSTRRSPRGERGLKYSLMPPRIILGVSRSPRGERGLKYNRRAFSAVLRFVAPPAGSVD